MTQVVMSLAKENLIDFFKKKLKILFFGQKPNIVCVCFSRSLFMHVIPSLFIIQSSIILEEEDLGGFCYLKFLIINYGVVL
jgi:hypothetical protein